MIVIKLISNGFSALEGRTLLLRIRGEKISVVNDSAAQIPLGIVFGNSAGEIETALLNVKTADEALSVVNFFMPKGTGAYSDKSWFNASLWEPRFSKEAL